MLQRDDERGKTGSDSLVLIILNELKNSEKLRIGDVHPMDANSGATNSDGIRIRGILLRILRFSCIVA